MCTLIIGRDVLGPGSIVLGANRDEDPARPSAAPAMLSQSPLVVGGRDARAGGTWFAVRGGQAVIAVLNRRAHEPDAGAPQRSRGLLALEVARAEGRGGRAAFADAALETARTAVAAHHYAPFSLVCAIPSGGWVLAAGGAEAPASRPIEPGWHVLTHGELDDASEPRTLRLMRKLDGLAPGSTGEAETRLLELLGLHGTFGDGAPPEPGAPAGGPEDADRAAVCIHAGAMVTVSASVFRLSAAGARYIHIEGRPCTTPPTDLTALLAP